MSFTPGTDQSSLITLYQYSEDPLPGFAIEMHRVSEEMFVRLPSTYLSQHVSGQVGVLYIRQAAYHLWITEYPNVLLIDGLTFLEFDEEMYLLRLQKGLLAISIAECFYCTLSAKSLASEPGSWIDR